jgi:peroxiredoxin Q/BCP
VGKKFMGISRNTFVIGSDGTIEKLYKKVKPDSHAEEILANLA